MKPHIGSLRLVQNQEYILESKLFLYYLYVQKLIYTRADASAALGHGPHPPHQLIKCGSLIQADRMFANMYMQGKVVKVYE
jgi:hypothetical protein